jgi:hypothetical protein
MPQYLAFGKHPAFPAEHLVGDDDDGVPSAHDEERDLEALPE